MKIVQHYPFAFFTTETFILEEDMIRRQHKSLKSNWTATYDYSKLEDEIFESRIYESGWSNFGWFTLVIWFVINSTIEKFASIEIQLSVASLLLVAAFFFVYQFKKTEYVSFVDENNDTQIMLRKKGSKEFVDEIVKRIRNAKKRGV